MSRQQLIEERLQAAFSPAYLSVLNESHNHSAGTDTHFKVVMAADAFAGVRSVARHQKVYAQLQDEMAKGLHALSLHLFTPAEWAATEAAPDSPACRGGSKLG